MLLIQFYFFRLKMTDRQTNGTTDGQTDKAGSRVACTRQKRVPFFGANSIKIKYIKLSTYLRKKSAIVVVVVVHLFYKYVQIEKNSNVVIAGCICLSGFWFYSPPAFDFLPRDASCNKMFDILMEGRKTEFNQCDVCNNSSYIKSYNYPNKKH